MRLTVTDRVAALAAQSWSFRTLLAALTGWSVALFPAPASDCLVAAVWLVVALHGWVLAVEIRASLRARRAARRLAA